MLLLVLAACGFAGALATRLLDPLLTLVAADFGTTAAAVAVLSTAFALPFGLSQPILGPLGDSVGKTRMIKVGVATLAFCLVGSALASGLTMLFLARILGGIAAGAIMPVCMAVIGDRFPIALRQIAMSRYVGATLVGQLVGASAGGLVAEWIGWRGVMGCAAVLAAAAATAAILFLPKADQPASPLRIDEALRRYRLVLMNPRSLVCFGVVFIEGLAIYGITPFIGQMLQERGAGGIRQAGFVIAGLGLGGILFALSVPIILKIASRPIMMVVGGAIAASGLAGVGQDWTWTAQMACMIVLGFGFFSLHNSVQTEVTELAPTARASCFSLHAFSFFMGQALGPIVYGLSLPAFGPAASLEIGAVALLLTGFAASRLLRPVA